MKTPVVLENLISEDIRNKLNDAGVSFSELRKGFTTSAKLTEAIYTHWRSGSIRVERNWNGILDSPETVHYSNSACFLPDDRIFLESTNSQTSWKVATWNVNSIRTRLPLLLNWLEENKPHVVCLQETKVEDSQFPHWELNQSGYESVFYGQKSYNGVAILSKEPIEEVQKGFRNRYDPENARLISATISGVRLINVYVPQGQTTESDKFQYKLEFLQELKQEIANLNDSKKPFAIMGDFNIAPNAEDVWNEEFMKNRVSFHPKEHEQLKEISKTGLTDIFRKFDQRPGQFSWWDFRTRGFERGEGMRIDYILANSVLTSSCCTCIIDLSARKQDRPSDHAPVIGEFNL